MYDSLRDPKVIIGILAIINTIVIAFVFQWWRHRKALSCEVTSDIPLFSVRQEIKHRVQVMLDGKAVENVHLILVKVMNSGSVPIEEIDFVNPISITFGADSEILTAEVTKTLPTDLPVKLTLDGEHITIEPLMLNRGDSIMLQVLASKLGAPIITGRIKGIPQIQKRNTFGGFGGYLYEGLKSQVHDLVVILGALIVALVSAAILSFERLGEARKILFLLPIVLLVIGIIYMNYRISRND